MRKRGEMRVRGGFSVIRDPPRAYGAALVLIRIACMDHGVPPFPWGYDHSICSGSPVTAAVKNVFNRSFTSVVQRLAHHPSVFGWVFSNEIPWDNACGNLDGKPCNTTAP